MSTFFELGLSSEILQGIEELGFVEPTPVQAQTIPHLLETEQDVISLAQTGTGKTAAFGLPLIQNVDIESRKVQALILSPTRELALQIAKDMENYSKYVKGFKSIAVYGGASIETQIRELKRGGQVVVGTPGRVLDLINRKVLKLDELSWMILDEADEMLNMGFKDELDSIMSAMPEERQTLLFSATMPREISNIADNFMTNPIKVEVGRRNQGADTVEHNYYMVAARDRYEALKRISDINPKIYGIVFCRTRQETKDVADKLMADGYNADALHGDLSQAQREYVMGRFRNKGIQMLVATDVAARGLDVNDLTHVINFNLPDDIEAYVHRSGRTGRAGKKGTSISIIHSREKHKIREISKISGTKFNRLEVPGGKEICEKQLFNLVDIMENVEINDSQIEQFMPAIYEKLEEMPREDLIKRFVSVEFNRFLEYYKNARDLNIQERGDRNDRGDRRDRGDRGDRSPRGNFTRFFISVGTMDNITVPRLLGVLNEYTQRRDIQVGRIDLMKKFSFFEVDKQHEGDILKAFQDAEFEGRKVSVEVSKPSPSRNGGGDRRSFDRRGGGDRRNGGGFNDRRRDDRRGGFNDRRRDDRRGGSSFNDRRRDDRDDRGGRSRDNGGRDGGRRRY